MRFAIRRELVSGLQLKNVLHYRVLNISKRYVLQAITLRCLVFEKTKIMASGPITSWQIDGETVETVANFIFEAPKSLQMVIVAMKLKDAYSLEGKL